MTWFVCCSCASATAAGVAEARDSAASAVRRARAVVDLARYVEWPEDAFAEPRAPFVIGILGPDPLAATLTEAARGRRAHGRPIVVRRFRNLDEYEPSQVLFVTRSKARLIDVVRDFLRSQTCRAVLTVGESEDFTHKGGLVRLVDRSEGIGFEIDGPAAAEAGLAIAAELLDLAEAPPPAPGAARR